MTSLYNFISTLIATPAIPLTVSIVVILMYTFYLDHKIVVLTRGTSGASLEVVIKNCIQSVATIEKKNDFISKHAFTLEQKVSHAIRNAQTIRYKAYDASGSNQSFSIALLNEHGNGVVISSLHSHDRMSTFAKPIQKYESSYGLTEEEVLVVEDAKKEHMISASTS